MNNSFRAFRLTLLTALLALPSFASLVSGNITQSVCYCGQTGPDFFAIEFSVVGADYKLTDVKEFMENDGDPQTTVDFFIYSNGSGVPGTELTELMGTVPADPLGSTLTGLITSGAPSVPLTLDAGASYWLVTDLPNGNIDWNAGGSSSVNTAYGSPGNWTAFSPGPMQYEIDGSVPEPGTFAFAAIGIALAALAHRRR